MRVKLASLLVCFLTTTAALASVTTGRVQRFLDNEDVLGFRLYIRVLQKKGVNPRDWFPIRAQILANADRAGYDLLYAWDQTPPAGEVSKYSGSVNRVLLRAEALMQAKKFSAAFNLDQRTAQSLKKERATGGKGYQDTTWLYNSVLEEMGRALYGAGRFADAYETFSWIDRRYPKFRRVLFEAMWAAFRAGRVDNALGKIASQRSSYFSRYLEPESYLVQMYVYKKLCRQDEIKRVIDEMRKFRDDLRSGKFTLADWAQMDNEQAVLWKLMSRQPETDIPQVTPEMRAAERRRILQALQVGYERDRKRWGENLDVALAYARLTTGHGSGFLKPITRLPSRQDLAKLDLEVWPADKSEDWFDEIGTHLYLGAPKCGL